MDDNALKNTAGDTAAAGAGTLPPAPATLDRAHLARMTLGDRRLEAEVLTLFGEHAETLVAGMGSNDSDGVRALAHALKGAAGGVGAFRVAAAAAEVETSAEGPPAARAAALARLNAAVGEARAAIASVLTST